MKAEAANPAMSNADFIYIISIHRKLGNLKLLRALSCFLFQALILADLRAYVGFWWLLKFLAISVCVWSSKPPSKWQFSTFSVQTSPERCKPLIFSASDSYINFPQYFHLFFANRNEFAHALKFMSVLGNADFRNPNAT